MKQFRKAIALCIAGVSFVFAANAQRSNCSVSPATNTQTLPDGSSITLTAFGNEAVHYLETTEGYTVLRNTNGFFEYAVKDASGNLTTSGVVAKDGTMMKSLNIEKHLRYSAEQRGLLTQAFRQLSNQEMGKAGPNPFPPKGTRKMLVLMIEYPDLPATVSKADFELLFNQPDYNGTGSFRDFYLKTSFGQLDLHADVHGWYQADSGYKYYGRNSSPNYNQATRRLVMNAVNAADSDGVDFTQYDNDSDGYVDGLVILHSGIGAEEQSAPNANDYIWSFRSSLGGNNMVDGVTISAYCMFPEKRYGNGAYPQVGIGVMCHEFGHILDLPDLYATDYSSEGAGEYTLMAGGPWLNGEKTPCLNDAWSRISLGWVQPIVINARGLYTIPKALADSDMVFRINTPQSNEYFLLENRQHKGFDSHLPSDGLAVWHIDENHAALLSQGFGNNVNNDTSAFGVGVLQADGRRDLEKGSNRGDANDLYPIASNKDVTPTSRPSTALNYKDNGIKQNSNVSITDITLNEDSSITFRLGLKGTAVFNMNKTVGCAPLDVTMTDASIAVDSLHWTVNGMEVSGDFSPQNFILQLRDAGTYNVMLKVYEAGSEEVVDSATKTVTVYAVPDASFTYTRDADTIYFNNTSTGGNFYQWKFANKQSNQTNARYVLAAGGVVDVTLLAYNNFGCVDTATEQFTFWLTGLGDNAAERMKLKAFPNPFNNELQFSFELSENKNVKAEVYNLVGEKIATEDFGMLNSGAQSLEIRSVQSAAPGVYFLRVLTGSESGLIKIMKM